MVFDIKVKEAEEEKDQKSALSLPPKKNINKVQTPTNWIPPI
jgi:hypothetical protein